MMVGTKEALLTASLALFHEIGFERTTVAQIRAAAGVSNGSFFHFFKSKEALGATLFLSCLDAYHQSMMEVLANSPSCVQGIEGLVQRHIDWVVSQAPKAKFLFEQARAEWLEDIKTERGVTNHEFVHALDTWRQPYMESGELLPLSSRVFTSQIIGPAQIFCRAWLSGRSAENPRLHADELVACALRAVVRERPRE